MTAQIPDSHADLFEGAKVATIATTYPDGTPQLTVVWFRLHEGAIEVSTTASRQKVINAKRNGRASLIIIDPDNVQRYIEVRGQWKLSLIVTLLDSNRLQRNTGQGASRQRMLTSVSSCV